jgi:hypothetical protein
VRSEKQKLEVRARQKSKVRSKKQKWEMKDRSERYK